MKKNPIFFVATIALIMLAGCAAPSPAAPIEIPTDITATTGVSPDTIDPTGDNPTSTICTMDYTPVCALVHIQCIKAPCNPVEQTFGNKCQMDANKLAEFLHMGECLPSETVDGGIDCPQWSQPAPSFCTDGIIVDGGKDAQGCQLPPTCQKK